MRNALFTATFAVIMAAVTAAIGQEPPAHPSVSLLPGTDKPAVTNCPDGAAYVYKEYTIYVIQNADFPGQDIHIYKPPSPPGDPCGAGKGEKYFSISSGESGGANFFGGISGNYLFIDQGTGPSYRTLSVFDIMEKKFPLLALRYSGARIEHGILTYYETRDEVTGALEKIPCPAASEWKKQGLNIIYEEKMSFDLRTGKESSLRQFRCSPAQ